MSDYAELTRCLAELIVRGGCNLQPGQILAITTSPGKEELTREVARVGYEHGARWVDVLSNDPWVKRSRLELAPEDSLEFVPPWMVERLEWLGRERAARATLEGPVAPHLLNGIPASRTGRDLLPYLPNTGRVVNERTTNWTVVPCPSRGWAESVFPELDGDEAYDRLWREIAHVCRLEAADPVAAWHERAEELESAAARLTERRFDAMHLRGAGTDLTIGLLPSSRWNAAGATTVWGLHHFSNLPTEEVYTTPDPERTEGIVRSTKPLQLYGTRIDGIEVEFRGGHAVRIDAAVGADALRAAAARDEAAGRLGELALVDGSGRIGPLGTVFGNTLLDENAASHIAIGNGYLVTVEDENDHPRVN
ncbi:MAG: aminopeptidase, partial [Gaiella sp.]